jgi:hypothetical protein
MSIVNFIDTSDKSPRFVLQVTYPRSPNKFAEGRAAIFLKDGLRSYILILSAVGTATNYWLDDQGIGV